MHSSSSPSHGFRVFVQKDGLIEEEAEALLAWVGDIVEVAPAIPGILCLEDPGYDGLCAEGLQLVAALEGLSFSGCKPRRSSFLSSINWNRTYRSLAHFKKAVLETGTCCAARRKRSVLSCITVNTLPSLSSLLRLVLSQAGTSCSHWS